MNMRSKTDDYHMLWLSYQIQSKANFKLLMSEKRQKIKATRKAWKAVTYERRGLQKLAELPKVQKFQLANTKLVL